MQFSMKSIKILLRNSFGQENLHSLMLIACDDPLPQKILPGPVVDKCLVSGNGGRHLNSHKKKIPRYIFDITKNLLLDELLTGLYGDWVVYLYCVRVWINKTINT